MLVAPAQVVCTVLEATTTEMSAIVQNPNIIPETVLFGSEPTKREVELASPPIVTVPVSVLAPFTVKVDEALKGPAMLRLAATEDEAVKISPARLVRVGLNVPVTVRLPLTVEEAEERNPPKVESPFTVNVDEALKGPATLKLAATEDEAVEIKPVKVVSPESVLAPETVRVPPVLILVPIVEE